MSLWSNLIQSEATTLRFFAALCGSLAANPSPEQFFATVQKAFALRVVSQVELAEIAMSEVASANRWVNGKAAPSARKQMVVLRELAKRANAKADELEVSP